MERIYLDNAAATPLDTRVLDAMMPYFTTVYGNPSSQHYFGQAARAAVQQARRQVAACLNVRPEEIVFTSGGTEADNLAVFGYLRANFPHGGHIITSAVEHHAVLRTFEALARQGYDVTVVPVDHTGRVRVCDVEQAIRRDTVLVSVMYANNETGAIQPVQEIGCILAPKGIAFHVDAVQAWGYVPVHPVCEHIDMLTVCGHKIYGPKGVGALYIRSGVKVAAEAYGGFQERRLRAGTENVPAIAGLGKAAELLMQERDKRREHAVQLRQYIYDHLIEGNPFIHYNGELQYTIPNIINISIAHANSAVILIALDRAGIAVSAGAACEAGAAETSHVLQAMGIQEPWLSGSIRISTGKENTLAEMEKAAACIRQAIQSIRQGGAL